MIGPACLADAIDYGSELSPRIRESLQLMRQLDLASRLATTAADKVLKGRAKKAIREEEDEEDEEEEEEDVGKAGSSKRGGRGGGRGGSKRGRGRGGKRGGGRGGSSSSSHKRKASPPPPAEEDEDETEEADIKALQRAALRCADEKVDLAVHIYDLLDTQIRRVDLDLRRLERHYGFIPPLEAAARMAAAAAGGGGGARGPGGVARGGAAVGAVALPPGAVTVVTGRAKAMLPSVDPNEPVYCICRQVAFGEMVACDNPSCDFEWFHYGCVGLARPPYGSWQCAQCKRRKSGSLGGGGGGAFKRPKPKGT